MVSDSVCSNLRRDPNTGTRFKRRGDDVSPRRSSFRAIEDLLAQPKVLSRRWQVIEAEIHAE